MSGNRKKPARASAAFVVACFLSGCTAAPTSSLPGFQNATAFDFHVNSKPISLQLPSYSFRFLNDHLVSHGWSSTSACKYGSISADEPDRNEYGWLGRSFVYPFFEKEGIIWQERSPPLLRYNANHLFRSAMQRVPIYEDPDGTGAHNRVVGYEDREDGLRHLCHQAWVPLRMAIGIRLHERTVKEWIDILRAENPGLPMATGTETIGRNVWTTAFFPLRPITPGLFSSPYRYYILPIGDGRFTLLLRLAAVEESLQDPMGFAALGAVFRGILESVRVETWSEAASAEYQALRQAAVDKVLRDCHTKQQKNEKLDPRCVAMLAR